MFGEEESPSLIKGVSFGMLRPGVTAQKILHLTSKGGLQPNGERMLDISVQSRLPHDGTREAQGSLSDDDMNEDLQTLTIPVVRPFAVLQDIAYSRRKSSRSTTLPSLGDLNSFDKDYWDDSYGGEASVKTIFECIGTSGVGGIMLLDIQLQLHVCTPPPMHGTIY